MNNNALQLARRGVHYEKQTGYPAHHQPPAKCRDTRWLLHRLSDALRIDKHRDRLGSLAREQIRRNLAAIPDYSEMIRDSFGQSTAEALKAFGYVASDQPQLLRAA